MQRGAVIGIAGLGPGSPIQRMRVGPSPHELNHFSWSSVTPAGVDAPGLGQVGHRGDGEAVALHVEPPAGPVEQLDPQRAPDGAGHQVGRGPGPPVEVGHRDRTGEVNGVAALAPEHHAAAVDAVGPGRVRLPLTALAIGRAVRRRRSAAKNSRNSSSASVTRRPPPVPQRARHGRGCAPGYIRSSSSRFMRWNSSSVTAPRSRRLASRSRSSRGVGARAGGVWVGGVGVRSATTGWGWVVA
jgi:hypothetical protein